MIEILREAHGSVLLRPIAEGREWDVILIETGLSKNATFYTADVLKAAIKLFEGAKACAYLFGQEPNAEAANDHLPQQVALEKPEGFAGNVIGWYESVRFGSFQRADGSTGEGLLARLHLTEDAEAYRKKMKDAYVNGKPDLLELSIDASGSGRQAVIDGKQVKLVEKIEEVRSVDLVARAAAGGGMLRLVASASGVVKVKDILDLIKKHRPSWLEGRADPEVGADLGDYTMRLLEGSLESALKEEHGTPIDEVQRLAEQARGVKTIQTVIKLMRAGEAENAMKLLQNWIAEYPEPGRSAESSAKGFFSYPFKKSQSDASLRQQGDASPARRESEDGTMPEPKTPEATDPKETELAQREKDLRIREAKLLIEQHLLTAELPDLAKKRVREGLIEIAESGEVSEETITAAIKNEGEYIASLSVAAPETEAKAEPAAARESTSGKPAGLGSAQDDPRTAEVKVEKEEYDRIVSAWMGFFDGGRPVDGVAPFTSLHEAFGKIVGVRLGRWLDREQVAHLCFEGISKAFPNSHTQIMEKHLVRIREGWGSVYKSDLFREAITTSDFSVAFGDAMFKRLQKTFNDDPLNDWRQIVSSIESLSDATNDFNIVRIGGVGTLPIVNQNAPYQEFTDPTEQVEKLSPNKHGALLKFTWEDALADRIGVLRKVPDMLARSANRTIHELVWDEIDQNPVIQGNALISSANNNQVSSDPALAYAAVTDAIQLLRDQTEQDSGKKLGFAPKFLLVGPTKENEAIEITDSTVKASASEDATVRSFVNRIGIQTFATLGLGRDTSPDTQFRWYVAISPRDSETIAVGFLGGRQRPDIFVQSPSDTPTAGAAFTADAMTFKSRLVIAAKIVDFRWIAGSLATS